MFRFSSWEDEEDDDSTSTTGQVNASGNHYQWQLFAGQQWSQICNDHIIESHYCQPGARGMTIYTSLGSLHIDFDDMTVMGPFAGLSVRRQTFLSSNQSQEVGWYYKDNTYWCEYGSQGSSVNSHDLEQQYNSNPRGSFQFKVGSTAYKLDFSAMTQTNLSTSMIRKVRRRPKFNSIVSANSSSVAFASSSLSTLSLNPPTAVTWEFIGDEGVWTEYQKPGSSLDSMDIEKHYQLNPQGQLNFTAGRYTYTLYFSGMYQINNTFGTKRHIRRTGGGNQPNNSALSQARWQFKDMDGCWKDYVKGSSRGSCTVSSQDIEAQYQQNSTGTMSFSTGKFSYQLDFSAMVQTNLSTNTRRLVRRL
ncbi:uncharacterized protein si:ch211-244b2.3 [Colossoma macropomum]|uniref:uncharacterized protein si:ch211-244b2.3 n=1 Tax=Colossoma macropomum TaxID=42526 RepID=UPI001863CD1F|nr:uncharacterized protein si:ch211-244b2.3 [Colossoma macropomum]